MRNMDGLMYHKMVFCTSHRVLIVKHSAHGLKGLVSKGRVIGMDLNGSVVVE
jgi:hypothetical protein